MWSILWFVFLAVSWLLLAVFVAYLVQLVRILRSDCDLTLSYYERRGKDPKNLRGKVIWITGASSGIGEALAYVLAESGCKLVLSARREEKLKSVCEKCNKLSPVEFKDIHMVLPLDLLNMNSHADACIEILQQFGRIDILVNNAGRSQRASAVETKLEVDRAVLEINTFGTLSLTKAVLPHLVEQKEGYIVVISSVAGKLGAPGSASYSASKHAIQGFFDTLRMEIAENGIGVLSVCPGPITTSFARSLFGATLDTYYMQNLLGQWSHNYEEDFLCLFPQPHSHNKLSMKSQPPSTEEEEGKVIHPTADRISSSRCAHLIAVAMANKLEEVWISKNPVLFFTYMNQYAPTIARWMGKRIGKRRLHAMKAGEVNVDGSYFTMRARK